jgi:secreted trypsin-like serine protease
MKKIIFTAFSLIFSSYGWSLTNSTIADAPEFDAIVAIQVDAHDPVSGDTVTGFCNGTLLSSRILLTAAHCVSDAQVLHSSRIHIEVGHYRYVKRPDGTTVRVGYAPYYTKNTTAQFFFSSNTSRKIAQQGFRIAIGPEEDMAVIVLSQPLELVANFGYANVIRQTDFSRMIQMNLNGLNVATVNLFANQTSSNITRVATLNSVRWSGNFIESTSTSRLEEGDSGAPIYAKTAAQGIIIAGVVMGMGRTAFGNWDAFAPAGSLICDIAHNIADQSITPYLCR